MNGQPEQLRIWHQEGRDLRIDSPGMGYAYTVSATNPTDAPFYDLFTTDAALRTLDVRQLSKGSLEETIPGLVNYTRYEHNANIFEIVRHFGHSQNLDNDTIAGYGLHAVLSDMAHGVKSHATDMIVEGVGGQENFHENRIGQIVLFGGVRKVLESHGVTPSSEVPSWVDCASPHPDVDRISYIADEAAIWFPGDQLVRDATAISQLEITEDQRFAFKDPDMARVWGKLGLLMSSEHWNDPINRLILMTSVETMKRTIFNRYLPDVDRVDNGHQAGPEDYTFFCDADFDRAFYEAASDSHHPDGFMSSAYYLLQTLGHTERMRFVNHKAERYLDFLHDEEAQEYPSTLINPHIAAFGPGPGSVDVLIPDEADKYAEKFPDIQGRGQIYTEDGEPIGLLKQLKLRQFDPLVITNSGAEALSKIDRNYASLLAQHKRALERVAAVRLLINRENKADFMEAIEANAVAMNQAKKDGHSLSPDQLRKVIRGAGVRALDLARSERVWRDR